MSIGKWLLTVLCLALGGPAHADIQRWNLETRRDGDGNTVFLPVLADIPAQSPKAVLLALDTTNGTNAIKEKAGAFDYGLPTGPIPRARKALVDRGFAILTPATPSDQPEGISLAWRESNEHRRDMETLAAEARRRWPGVQVVMTAYMNAAASAVALAENHAKGIDGYVVLSGAFNSLRNDPLSSISARGLVIHPVSHRCDQIPTPEAREVAAAAHWQFIEAGHDKIDAKPGCFTNYRSGLVGLDAEYTQAIAGWVLGETIPATIGKIPAAVAYKESVFVIPGATRGLFGLLNIEVTLFTPPGDGPFPLVVFNHGDVEDEANIVKRRMRYRDMFMANEFMTLGFAVAFPARPGVGRSEGTYQRFASAKGIYIGSATGLLQKGLTHLAEGMVATEYLRGLPGIDPNRVVMTGQSAGGFAVSCLGTLTTPLPWLKAIVNFSGGRTDVVSGGPAGEFNEGMVSAFGAIGETSRIPSLWIFAENDSRYSANTIRASYAAFSKAGGNARLALYPASKTDGHFVYHEPEKWRQELRKFLAEQGLVKDPV